MESNEPTHLLVSLLSVLLTGLTGRKVETTDAALLSALKSVSNMFPDDEFEGSVLPELADLEPAGLWTLPTSQKAALLRYLAEWSLEANDKIKDHIDAIYADRDSEQNDLSVLRVGKDRNRNSFFMLRGYPRLWRETVAGNWGGLTELARLSGTKFLTLTM